MLHLLNARSHWLQLFHFASLANALCIEHGETLSKARDMALRTQFIDAMSSIVSSVSIVTTDGPAGRAGATISAMTSVSADGDTPTLLICLHHQTSAAAAVIANKSFCINVLNHDQTIIADTFASRHEAPGGDKFNASHFDTTATGCPRLSDALASFDCQVISQERIGTHHVIIGAVQSVATTGDGEPLLYGNRKYTRAD
jgi:flavin reductase